MNLPPFLLGVACLWAGIRMLLAPFRLPRRSAGKGSAPGRSYAPLSVAKIFTNGHLSATETKRLFGDFFDKSPSEWKAIVFARRIMGKL